MAVKFKFCATFSTVTVDADDGDELTAEQAAVVNAANQAWALRSIAEGVSEIATAIEHAKFYDEETVSALGQVVFAATSVEQKPKRKRVS